MEETIAGKSFRPSRVTTALVYRSTQLNSIRIAALIRVVIKNSAVKSCPIPPFKIVPIWGSCLCSSIA